MIRCDERNPKARALRDELCIYLPNGVGGDDLVIVIGGDGFLLHTVGELGTDRTFFGLNAGHMGFLLNDPGDFEAMATALINRAFQTYRFPLLHARIELASGDILEEVAVNDVYLERASGQTARLSIAIQGDTVVDSLVADGIIFATALGSTAYNFSAGGMACHPELPILTVTPICPHHPRLHPFALPASASARVEVQSGEHRPVRAVVDGRATEPVQAVEIEYRDRQVRLAYLAGHDFTARMIRKILAP